MILSPFPMRRRSPATPATQPQPIGESSLDAVSGGASATQTDSSTSFDAVSTDEVISPRDPASGLPTGKRMHKPIG